MNSKYTSEEKQNAIAHYNRGESVISITLNTGIARSTLYKWINEYNESSNKNGSTISRKEAVKLKLHIEKLEHIIEVLKAVDCTASAPLQEKLAALEPLYSQYSVYVLCEALDVPRGTFYNYILRNKRSNSSYAKHREEMRLQIKRCMMKTIKSLALEKSRQYYRVRDIGSAKSSLQN